MPYKPSLPEEWGIRVDDRVDLSCKGLDQLPVRLLVIVAVVVFSWIAVLIVRRKDRGL